MRVVLSIVIPWLLMLAGQATAQTRQFEIHLKDTINLSDEHGLKQGLWREFWANGDVKSEVTYTNGRRQGLEIQWYDFPDCVSQEAYYRNDTLDGTVTYYSKKCHKDYFETYQRGIKEGPEVSYYSNGMIRAEGRYKKGHLDGYYRIYDRKGHFSFESRSTDTETNLQPNMADTANNLVYQVFQRNPQWKNKLVVADLTGSMYPYAQQISTWLKLCFLRDSTRQHFVFFNDGDNKRDDKKRVGSTGGIYYCKAANVEQLIATMEHTIKKGQGGDAPENPVEAILYGLEKVKSPNEIILIADNWADARDIKLLVRIKIPVRVILCGVYEGMTINEDYLNIAYKTKGSIHTIEQDITNLIQQESGKKFTINGVDYIIQNGTIKSF